MKTKLIIYLCVYFFFISNRSNLIVYSADSDITTLPHLAYLQSGFDGFNFQKLDHSKFRIFDLSDNSKEVLMNKKKYKVSSFVQYTETSQRTTNSSLGIFSSYEDFFHSYTQDFSLQIGFSVNNVSFGLGYDSHLDGIKKSIQSVHGATGLSEDVRTMFTLQLGPAFMLPYFIFNSIYTNFYF